MPRQRSIVPLAVASITVVAAVATGCTRPSTPVATATTPGTPPSAHSSTSSSAAANFGSEQKVCAPGPGTGGSGRGIDGKTIHIGVMADPGAAPHRGWARNSSTSRPPSRSGAMPPAASTVAPSSIDKHDAALFNVGPQMVTACQNDFMLVGGGNALDVPGVGPRVACKLGAIPAYTVSPEATTAALQVTPTAPRPGSTPSDRSGSSPTRIP